MKTKTLTLILAGLLLAASASSQVALTSTTTTAAVLVNQTVIPVTSATGITANPRSILYIIDKNQRVGELVTVTAVSGTNLTVERGASGTRFAHATGAYVIIGSAISEAQSFQRADPAGNCVAAQTLFTPWINVVNGRQWLCSTLTLTWVAGWNTPDVPAGITADVASAAGVVLPGGPLFTMTGTAAITGFTLPVGFAGGSFCAMPTGAFTWTTATNIGLAGTAVVGRVLCFTYNVVTAKWLPSYV